MQGVVCPVRRARSAAKYAAGPIYVLAFVGEPEVVSG